MNTQTPNMKYLLEKALTEKGTISKCYSMFNNFSFNNTIWVMIQLQAKYNSIKPIGTFAQWKKINRYVRKGEHASISMLYPIKRPITVHNDETGKDEKVWIPSGRFEMKTQHFAFEQTDGQTIENKMNDFYKLNIKKVLEKLEIKVIDYDSTNRKSQGYAYPDRKEIAISPIAENPVKTSIHEISHCLLHSDKCKLEKELKEAEAELTANLVLSVLEPDMDLSSSRAYIQDWLGNKEFTEENATRVLKTVNKILQANKE